VGEKWERRYSAKEYVYGTEPVRFLRDQIRRLGRGKALCLAAGEGRNAVYLAQQGFQVVAVDISEQGLAKCRRLARQRGVEVETIVADLNTFYLGEAAYDLITDFYYYDARLFPKIMAALRPGGRFILQNFSVDQPTTNRFGPRNPAYLVKPNELLTYFSRYRVRYYEDGVVRLDEGMHAGPGAVVRLIVEKVPVHAGP
jgi:SAM-dependent methyltransferase